MTQFLLLYKAPIGAISRLLCSAAFKRKAALVGSLALFVVKTRSGAKVVGSYTPACHRANILRGPLLECSLYVIMSRCTDMQTHLKIHALQTCIWISSHALGLLFIESFFQSFFFAPC